MWNESLVENSVILALRNTGIKRIRENSPGIGTRDPTTPPSRFLSFQVKLNYTCVIPHRSLFNLFLGLGTIEMLPSPPLPPPPQTGGSEVYTIAWILMLTSVSYGFGKSTKYCKNC